MFPPCMGCLWHSICIDINKVPNWGGPFNPLWFSVPFGGIKYNLRTEMEEFKFMMDDDLTDQRDNGHIFVSKNLTISC